jgi:hypothetical protein
VGVPNIPTDIFEILKHEKCMFPMLLKIFDSSHEMILIRFAGGGKFTAR